MQLSEWLISVFVPFLQIYIGAHVPVKKGLATAMMQTIQSSHHWNSVGLICKDFILKSREGKSWCSRRLSRHWPCHERWPHSLDAPIPTKAFWHIRCPPVYRAEQRRWPPPFFVSCRLILPLRTLGVWPWVFQPHGSFCFYHGDPAWFCFFFFLKSKIEYV